MRGKVLVQHRFMIETRDVGDVWTVLNTRETIKFDGENGAEFAEEVEQPFAVGLRGQSHPQGPSPTLLGSWSQSGGVSQTKARIAITHRS